MNELSKSGFNQWMGSEVSAPKPLTSDDMQDMEKNLERILNQTDEPDLELLHFIEYRGVKEGLEKGMDYLAARKYGRDKYREWKNKE